MDTVRIGVIGCGYWGPNLIRNFVDLPTATVVGAADLREERRAHIKRRYPQVTVTDNYRDLFSMGLDGVVVATPPATHFPIARECLEHGLHILIEKPFTLDSQEASMLIELADARGLQLMVGHTFEYNPAVQALKDIMDSGELGDIYYISTMRLNLGLFQPDSNVLWDLAPHDVSILQYLLGSAPLSVGASGGACIFKKVYDVVFLYMRFPGDVLAHTRISWLDPCKVRHVTVVGSKKMAVYDDVELNEKIRIYDKGVETMPYTDTFGEFQLQYHHGDIVTPHIHFIEPLHLECEHFIKCIINGQKPRSCGRVGLSVVKTLEAAERSLNNGGLQEKIL
ncbi:MAG: Gfo/Idh/MocA family oxidoreductase [Anaerolineae bacterium]|nr:Gfo/Idh/MocA family oxidoreductase [Anaerolineae bacterium]